MDGAAVELADAIAAADGDTEADDDAVKGVEIDGLVVPELDADMDDVDVTDADDDED